MIDYALINESILHYESLGYKRIEAPWTVSKATNAITKPEGVEEYEIVHNGKCLVASGEQSFLYLYSKGFLPKGRFQTVTPCFRSDSFGPYHTKYFIKNELINTEDVDDLALKIMIEDALLFVYQYFDKDDVRVIQTDIGYDINHKGLELGSYGIRQCEYLKWVYGTGLAEPRFSRELARVRGL